MKMSSKFGSVVASICCATFITNTDAQKLSDVKDYSAKSPSAKIFNNTAVNTNASKNLATAPPYETTYNLTVAPSRIKTADAVYKNAVTIKFKSRANQAFYMSLVNDNGDVLYTKSDANINNFFELLNLKNLDLGNYNLTIKKGLIKTIQPFELTHDGVVMNEKKRITKFLPQILIKDTKLDVNAMMTKFGTVRVKIYKADDQIVFEENITKIISLNKRYDISKLHHGEYTVEVLADNESAYLEIKL